MTNPLQLPTDFAERLQPFIDKMRSASQPTLLIDSFSRFYQLVLSGQQGLIPEKDIDPVQPSSIVHLDDLKVEFYESGLRLLNTTAILKLNGGLGTTMGCSGPKSLVTIRNNNSFLDIILKNLSWVNAHYHTQIPLLLMNSFSTDKQTRDALDHPLRTDCQRPSLFMQHKFPKVDVATRAPACYPADPELEWNPPGHGDLYLSLLTSGLLDKLLAKKTKYLFVSNSDNLGAHIDPAIPGYMDATNCDFLMEVAERNESDQKGGHVARFHDGQLVLREIRQCPTGDLNEFRDITKHRFFNTNNIWINLEALNVLLKRNNGVLELPLICNQKRINPLQPSSPKVYQLESAMGAALSLFTNATVLHVPRTRFFPVKTCDDLLLLQSDFFKLGENFTFETNENFTSPFPLISLDPTFFHTVDLLLKHFPYGAPSLKKCTMLKVSGDVYFGKDITIEGSVTITNTSSSPFILKDNQVLTSNIAI